MKLRVLLPFVATATALAAEPPLPQFRAITLDDRIQIGYGLAVADVDGDKAPDILLADKKQFVWYRNPGKGLAGDPAAWKKHLLAENLTARDNACIAAQDIDGDGQAEVAVGADWNPADTEKSGAVFYLQAPADRTQPWTPIQFPEVEPTTHRMRWIKVAGESVGSLGSKVTPAQWGLLVLPLHGRGNKNGEGAPVKVLVYHPPGSVLEGNTIGGAAAAPATPWRSEVVSESLHLTHNFARLSILGDTLKAIPDQLMIGGREGLVVIHRRGGKWFPVDPPTFRGKTAGVGEVRLGSLLTGEQFITTVEPMHGRSLVVYGPGSGAVGAPLFERRVLTDRLVEGHALACGNLLGGLPSLTASDQIVVGWRGKPGAPGSTTGLALWASLDARGVKWRETILDPDGMACEDLLLADLDADGKLDIVAAGRATKNVKIYFNETPSSPPRIFTAPPVARPVVPAPVPVPPLIQPLPPLPPKPRP